MSAGLLIFRWVGGWIKHDAIKGDAPPRVGPAGSSVRAPRRPLLRSVKTPDNDPEAERDSKLCRVCQRKHMLGIRELRSIALDSEFLAFHPNRFFVHFFPVVSVRNKRAKRQTSKSLNSFSRL